MTLDLEAIRARREAMTQGKLVIVTQERQESGLDLLDKWIQCGCRCLVRATSNYPRHTERGKQELADLEFFASAPSDIDLLSAGIVELRGEIEQLQPEYDALREKCTKLSNTARIQHDIIDFFVGKLVPYDWDDHKDYSGSRGGEL